jgi:methylated-DNA-[protein]-cysteine S-methyltransferase
MSAPKPIGLLFLAAGERGLRYLQFMERKSIKRVIASLSPREPGAEWQPSLLTLKPVVEQLDAYFNGMLTVFELPLDLRGSDFQCAVWHGLRDIPFAETRSYGDIARAIRQPRAPRAVGLANNQNPIAIIVPCHRVIGADGGLTGYGGGLPRKKWLLEHERRVAEVTRREGPVWVPSARPATRPAATPAKRAPAKRTPATRRATKPRPAPGARAARTAR